MQVFSLKYVGAEPFLFEGKLEPRFSGIIWAITTEGNPAISFSLAEMESVAVVEADGSMRETLGELRRSVSIPAPCNGELA